MVTLGIRRYIMQGPLPLDDLLPALEGEICVVSERERLTEAAFDFGSDYLQIGPWSRIS